MTPSVAGTQSFAGSVILSTFASGPNHRRGFETTSRQPIASVCPRSRVNEADYSGGLSRCPATRLGQELKARSQHLRCMPALVRFDVDAVVVCAGLACRRRRHLRLDSRTVLAPTPNSLAIFKMPLFPFTSAFLMFASVLARSKCNACRRSATASTGQTTTPVVIGNETEMVGRPANLPTGLDP